MCAPEMVCRAYTDGKPHGWAVALVRQISLVRLVCLSLHLSALAYRKTAMEAHHCKVFHMSFVVSFH